MVHQGIRKYFSPLPKPADSRVAGPNGTTPRKPPPPSPANRSTESPLFQATRLATTKASSPGSSPAEPTPKRARLTDRDLTSPQSARNLPKRAASPFQEDVAIDSSPVSKTPSRPRSHSPFEFENSDPQPCTPKARIRPLQTMNTSQRKNVYTAVNTGAKSADEVGHAHQKYTFLYPPERRDINGYSPDHPDYDDKTLRVPDRFLNSQTPAMRQWWLIKQRNMNAILFFKMGKFYELFNEDAVTGVKVLDINYMKGDNDKPAHAGFPESSFDKYAKIMIDRGYRVIRIEQTETPAMLEERCLRTNAKSKFDKVVKREICQITTKGTQMMGLTASAFHSAQNQYLLAIREIEDEAETSLRGKIFGVAFIDITICKLHLGQFRDDHNLSSFNALLAHHKPTEILFEKGNISQAAHQAILRTGALLNALKAEREFWPIQKALAHLKTHNIFQEEDDTFKWPEFLRKRFVDGEQADSLIGLMPDEGSGQALRCFAALVYYLQNQLILGQAMNCVTFELYKTPFDRGSHLEKKSGQSGPMPPMIMDHIALRNLEILENIDGGEDGTLFSSINYCKTHFGQRLLKNWLCSPLCDIQQLENRLDAVAALVDNRNASLMNEIKHTFGQIQDIERSLARIKSQCFKSESDTRAIMFDNNMSKAKISSFLNLLKNFEQLHRFIASIRPSAEQCGSSNLKRLLTFTTNGGLYPEYSDTIEYFKNAFDHRKARETGTIVPSPGVDKDYDECEAKIQSLGNELDDYLDKQKRLLKCPGMSFFGSAKNRYQIQVEENVRVPSDWRIETTRKGWKRYYTPVIDRLFKELTIHEEHMKRILDNIMSRIFAKFVRKIGQWSTAVECIAIVDVIQSIANFGRSLKADNIDVCRPEFVYRTGSSAPLIEYRNGRHPALIRRCPDFTANDLTLDDRVILLSGANMGGKSTLMRQTALIVVLAQLGSLVPASSARLTPVDRIFSRLGASDRLMEGESTFYTELVETSAMLRRATADSLLLLDELGRGTATYDGTAIAYSVLTEISTNLKCRCLFSTHYHTLVRDFQSNKLVRLAHMACKVERDDKVTTRNSKDQDDDTDPLKESITFLYKLVDGPVGRSYGFNVARLAGVSDDIIRNAYEKSKELEMRSKVIEQLQTLHLDTGGTPKSEIKRIILDALT